MITTHPLLDETLAVNIEHLSNPQKQELLENKQNIIPALLHLFSTEIPLLQEKKTCENPTALLRALQLAAFLQASETFTWIYKLCFIPFEIIEEALGDSFLTDDLPYLLANTIGTEWHFLKSIIEDPNRNPFIGYLCLDVLVLAVAKGTLKRSEIIPYFKSLCHRILNGELKIPDLPTDLVMACSQLWPGECLEEIKEFFGLDLIDISIIELADVLNDFAKGQEECIEKEKMRLHHHIVLNDILYPLEPEEMQPLFQKSQSERSMKIPQRNDLCPCNSGLKYKKCCLSSDSAQLSRITIKESAITYDRLVGKNDSPEEHDESIYVHDLSREDPQTAVEILPLSISKYPNNPKFYNYLYIAYRRLNQPWDAFQILKESLRRFPDYLFGRIEYALYLLRKGEAEQAHTVLGRAEMLPQLYPERDVFHISEWRGFCYVKGLYYIHNKDFKMAHLYLKALQKIDPDGMEAKVIEGDMRRQLRA